VPQPILKELISDMFLSGEVKRITEMDFEELNIHSL